MNDWHQKTNNSKSKHVAYLIKHANYQLYRVYTAGIIFKKIKNVFNQDI